MLIWFTLARCLRISISFSNSCLPIGIETSDELNAANLCGHGQKEELLMMESVDDGFLYILKVCVPLIIRMVRSRKLILNPPTSIVKVMEKKRLLMKSRKLPARGRVPSHKRGTSSTLSVPVGDMG